MKIVLLHNLYGELTRGGAENVVSLMAQELRASGQTVFLITTKPREIKSLPDIDPTGLKIYYLDSDFYNLGGTSLPYRLFWQIGNIFSVAKYGQIKKILKQEKPDLAITHNLMGLGFLTPLILRRLHIRQEHFLHDIQLLHPSGLLIWGSEKKIGSVGAKIYQFFTRRGFASPAKIISPSRWLLDIHKRHGFFSNSEIEIRPLRLKTEGMTDNLRPRDKKKPAKNFLFVGQLEAHKGILFLIETFK